MFAALTGFLYIAAGNSLIIHYSFFTIHYSFSAALCLPCRRKICLAPHVSSVVANISANKWGGCEVICCYNLPCRNKYTSLCSVYLLRGVLCFYGIEIGAIHIWSVLQVLCHMTHYLVPVFYVNCAFDFLLCLFCF